MTKIRLVTLILLAFSVELLATPSDIFLLRHSEKLGGKDPALSAKGELRAQQIAKLLSPYQPTLLLSTKYQRTMQTIAPLAKQLSLNVESYNPGKLKNVATWLKNQTGVVVVVGHSNTTPELTQLLSGEDVAAMGEQEYDAIYHIHYQGKQVILRLLSSESSSDNSPDGG